MINELITAMLNYKRPPAKIPEFIFSPTEDLFNAYHEYTGNPYNEPPNPYDDPDVREKIHQEVWDIMFPRLKQEDLRDTTEHWDWGGAWDWMYKPIKRSRKVF